MSDLGKGDAPAWAERFDAIVKKYLTDNQMPGGCQLAISKAIYSTHASISTKYCVVPARDLQGDPFVPACAALKPSCSQAGKGIVYNRAFGVTAPCLYLHNLPSS